jgi:hypothetical protein
VKDESVNFILPIGAALFVWVWIFALIILAAD